MHSLPPSHMDSLRPVEGELAGILDACLVRQHVPELPIAPRKITRVKAVELLAYHLAGIVADPLVGESLRGMVQAGHNVYGRYEQKTRRKRIAAFDTQLRRNKTASLDTCAVLLREAQADKINLCKSHAWSKEEIVTSLHTDSMDVSKVFCTFVCRCYRAGHLLSRMTRKTLRLTSASTDLR
jgi:hypothetical protein